MANRSLPFLLLVQCLLLFSVSAEFNEQEKQKYVSCFINFLNKLPQPLYFYEDGTLLNVQEFGKDEYEIEVSISAREFNDPEIIKLLKCKSSMSNNEEDVMSVNTYDCHEEVTEPEGTTPYTEIQEEVPQVTEQPFEQHPVKLENEVQPDNVETSGEQFIAIPRPSPSAPCIGCASNVDVNAAGVHELAVFAVEHLDRHDQNNRHLLVSVTEVQRQVQVINGVRYILTLNIDFDNCSLVLNQDCKEQKTCRIGVLEKPWLKHPDGSKFRAVVSNNCTDEWLFDEVLPSIPEGNQENKDNNETIKPNSSDDDSKKGLDTIIATHDAGLQSQVPTQENTITEEHLKDIQKQIITDDDKYTSKDANKFINSVNTISKLNSLSDNNQELAKRYEGITNKQTVHAGKADDGHASPVISNDKIKAIEDLMSYFQFDLKKVSDSNQNNIRIRRHYDTDIHGKSPINKYNKMKRNADNAKYLYTIGQAMVDHLNEKEPQIKSRVLKDVIKAEEEFGNNESFVYIQARVSKCDKMKCNTKEEQNEICNAVINTSDHINPKVINVFCHFESMGHKLGKITPVPLYDPILVKLSSDALKKIESESSNEKALKILKVLDASTQTLSGIVTKFTMEIGILNCENTIPIWKRLNCTMLTEFGTMICSVIVHNRAWLKKSAMDYSCIDRPRNEVFDFESDNNVVGFIDPKTLKMAQDVVQNLNLEVDINYKPRVVEVTSVSTQLVAGLLTNINFTLGLTKCPHDLGTKASNCELLDDEPLRKCIAHIWERPWIEKGRLVNVSCDQTVEKVNLKYVRNRRHIIPGGIQEQDSSHEKFRTIAEKSLLNYYKLSNVEYIHKVVKVNNASTQVVAGSLTRVDFDISPTSCLVKDLGSLEGTNCLPKNPSDVLHCHSEVWSRPWLQDGEQITIECKDEHLLPEPLNQNILHKIRKIRETDSPLVGGIQKENPTNEKYLQIAEKSLLNYYKLSNIEYVHKVVKVTKASTQVVAGSLTRVDFDISPTSCLVKDLGSLEGTNCLPKNPTDVLHCHSEVWSRPWLPDGEQITIECKDEDLLSKPLNLNNKNKLDNIRNTRETVFPLVGGIKEENSKDEKYLQIAEKSLLNYYKLSNIEHVHKVIKVTKASTQVVAGSLTRVDFDISPTSCLVKDLGSLEGTNCPPKNPTDVLHCHSEVWSRPWLPDGEQINITCNDEPNIRSKRNIIGGPKNQETNKKKYANLAEEALRKYETLSKSEYAHRVTKVDQVTTQVVSGKITKIEFTTSQTICFANDISFSVRKKCNLQIPKTEQKCKAKIWERPWLKSNGKEVTINCYLVKQNIDTPDFDLKNSDSHEKDITIGQFINSEPQPIKRERSKRYTRTNEEEFIDEDASYFYADQALKYLNSISDSGNLYKLVSIYNTQNSYHMNVQLVRMYIEVALTYCTEASKPQSLDRCDEIEGVSHRMCLARAWPSSQDELILDNIDVVCDDELKFPSVTGISTSDLVEASLTEIEKSSKVKYKLVVKGEPKVIPSLESANPTKLSFIVQSLTCHKNVSIEKMNTECKLADSKPSRECISYIWLLPGENVVRKIKAFCIIDKTRRKRSVDNTNSELDLEVKKYIEDSIDKLEMSSLHRYKQKLLRLNNVSRKFTSGRVTTIDFHIGYTSCLKYEWVENLKSCEFVDHLPRRHCISNVWERLWDKNGNFIDVTCQDDPTPLEKHMNVENKTVTEELAKEALKHIEAKYPHPYKQRIVRILSLEKQAVAGIHYRMKVEVGYTDCAALTLRENCNITEMGLNKFCSVNVWIRPWVNNGANVRVSCDYQESTTADIYLHVQAEHLFGEFVATYKPIYANDWSEMAKRFEIFKANVRKIQELNIHERGTATYGVTKFSDLTYEEFSSKYLGLKPGLRNENDIPMAKAKIPDVEVADKFDWRDHGAVTEVKNQGSCGSCWAFSVTGNIEGQWKLKKGKLISLSEQELVDCDKLDEGCNGGLPDNAYRAIEELGGLETEDDYPYEAVDDKCAYNKTMSKVQISGAVNITTNETDMAKWLTKNGPISIGLNANAMQFYVGGISHPWKALCNPKNLDHGVLIVGYGIKDYPLFNKHLPYWTIKNSWGSSWGEQGYYRLYRGDGTCGVNQMASSAVV